MQPCVLAKRRNVLRHKGPFRGHRSKSRHRRGAREETSLPQRDRKSTRLNSSHGSISYAVFCVKKTTDDHWHIARDAGALRAPNPDCGHHRKTNVVHTEPDSWIATTRPALPRTTATSQHRSQPA